MTIKELFEQMPHHVNTAAVQGVNKTIQFRMTGDEPGNYVIRVADGGATMEEGETEKADITITAPSDVWMDVSTGKLNGAVAFMTGKFKAEGDMTTLMAMQNWFVAPS